jgi:hypothetical protein
MSDEFKRARKLHEGVTEGPWEIEDLEDELGPRARVIDSPSARTTVCCGLRRGDAQFIAQAGSTWREAWAVLETAERLAPILLCMDHRGECPPEPVELLCVVCLLKRSLDDHRAAIRRHLDGES